MAMDGTTPLKVASIRVEGAPNTRHSFLTSLIEPLAPTQSSLKDPVTLQSVLESTRRIGQLLYEADIFQSVEAKIEKCRDTLASNGDIDLVFKTREKGRLFLNTSTEVGNGEGNASVTARIRNAFGGAEFVEANFSFGTKTRRSFQTLLSTPLTHTLKTRGELSVFGLERDNTNFASSSERLRGLKAVIRSRMSGSALDTHEFAYEAVLRKVGGLTPTASISMREAAGQTLKSSVSHTWMRDTRDDKITTTRGLYTRVFQEFAGLGGDASFYKAEAEGQLARTPIQGITISFAARSGFLWSINQNSLFSDRFQLGGPVSIRSFRANGMGPRDGFDSLGGDLFWSAGLSLITNIPWKSHWPVKSHAFVNAGKLDNMNRARKVMENVADCFLRPSISVGVGIIYKFDPVRVEVNFGLPLLANQTDRWRRGIQVGMGLEFL